jgi:Domain of unknown function (DUF5655)
MATDEREEEREFLAGLKARTGRDLGEWMAAIEAQGFADKNEIIDWLREQGLPFARASWLERIHRNGGRPIYAEAPARKLPERPRESQRSPTAQVKTPAAASAPAVTSSVTVSAPAPAPADAAAVEKLVAAAKGYRPLYHLIEQEMRSAIPGLTIAPKQSYLSFGAPAEFAALTLHASELRLGLSLGDRPFDGFLQKARLKGPNAAITHMAVLTDARQVNEELMAAIRLANSRVNG